MEKQVVFAPGVTIETLNPHNFHLKNDYIDNLLNTAFSILPKVSYILGDSLTLKINRGFLSASYINNNFSMSPNKERQDELFKHSRGLAVEITWDDFDVDDANAVALSLFNAVQQPIKIIIKPLKRALYVCLGEKESKILEETDSSRRTIRK